VIIWDLAEKKRQQKTITGVICKTGNFFNLDVYIIHLKRWKKDNILHGGNVMKGNYMTIPAYMFVCYKNTIAVICCPNKNS
jgi:hypothetical protein